MDSDINEEDDEFKFVYLNPNIQKVSKFISTYNKASIFALSYAVFFLIYQIQKHIAIYFQDQQPNDPFTSQHELQMYQFNLHTLYSFLTVLVSFLLAYKAWQIKKQGNFQQFGIDRFKRGFTKIQDYTYFNLLLVLFCLVRFFEAGLIYIWVDLISSMLGISLGKLLQKERQNIIQYSTQLKEQAQD